MIMYGQRSRPWVLQEKSKALLAGGQLSSLVTPTFPHCACHTRPGPAQHLAAVPTILHVDPVVLVIPKALNSQEVIVLGAVAVCSEWVNEKALRHLAFPRQHQDPGVHTEAVQGVGLCILLLLHGKGG